MALTVSFGRNVGTVPMPDSKWRRFRRDVQSVLCQTVGCPDTKHYGHGLWDGIREESSVVTVFEPRSEYVPKLLAELSRVANRYDQDAIAVTNGETVFAERS